MTETERIFAGRFSTKEIYDFIDEVLSYHSNQHAESIRMSDAVFIKLGKPVNYKGVRIEPDGQLWPNNVVQVVFRARKASEPARPPASARQQYPFSAHLLYALPQKRISEVLQVCT
jgi:hypothetical protein